MTMQETEERAPDADEVEEDASDAGDQAQAAATAEKKVAKAEEKKESQEEELARLRKETQRLKSQEGSWKARQRNEDQIAKVLSELGSTRAELKRLREENGLIFDYFSSPEEERTPESIKAKRATLTEQERVQQEAVQATRRYEAKVEKTEARMNARVTALALPLEELETNAHFKRASALFAKGVQAKDEDALADALDAVSDLVEEYREKRTKAAIETARKEGREAEREALGVADTASPKGGASEQSPEDIYAAYGRGDIPWSKRVEEAGKKAGYL